MSFFRELINAKIRELEELKQNLLIEIETRLRKSADTTLAKFNEQVTNVESQVTLERERVLYDAMIEARRKIAEAYENMLRDLVDSIYQEVDKIRGTERYSEFLKRLIESAVQYVGTKDVVIYASPKDRGVVETIARTLGITGTVSEKDIKGGVIVGSKDGTVVADFSLETLVNSKLEDLKYLLKQEL